jgi:hypothetical protein
MKTLLLLGVVFCFSVSPVWAQFTVTPRVSGLTAPTSFAFLGP